MKATPSEKRGSVSRSRSLTDEILEEMTTILVAAQNITLRAQDATDITRTDRETIIRASTRISSQADTILAWLFETPLDTTRH
jgi:hypothetical protein